jgi:hypothetical protein
VRDQRDDRRASGHVRKQRVEVFLVGFLAPGGRQHKSRGGTGSQRADGDLPPQLGKGDGEFLDPSARPAEVLGQRESR